MPAEVGRIGLDLHYWMPKKTLVEHRTVRYVPHKVALCSIALLNCESARLEIV